MDPSSPLIDNKVEEYGAATTDKDEYKRLQKANGSEEDSPPVSYFMLYKYSTCGEKFLIFLSVICALASGCAEPLQAIILGDCLDLMVNYQVTRDYDNSSTLSPEHHNVSSSEFMDKLREYCIDIAIVGAVQFCIIMFMIWALNYTAEKQLYRIRDLFMKSILKQEIGWFDTNKTGDFSSKVGENLLKLQEGISEKVALSMYFTGTFIISISVALAIGWQLTLVILSVLPLIILCAAIITSFQAKFASREMKAYGKAGAIAEEILGAFRTVVSFGGEQKEIKRYDNILVAAKDFGIKRGYVSAAEMACFILFIFVSYAIGFWYGTKLVIDNRIEGTTTYTPGTILKVFANVLTGAMFLGQAAQYLEVFSVAKAAARDVYNIIELKPNIDSSSNSGNVLPHMSGKITFEDVHFSYPSRKDVQILQGISFEVKKGETVALVGSSGCGKSTITQLIQRFYDVDEGSVYIDGENIKDLNVGWLRDNIGLVGQEPSLFATTITENIRLGKEVSDEEILKATKSSNAHNFISSLPNKYETVVGSKGSQMSGGQKQRIAIARALVRDPKILLLDEATSALDTESESLVQSALDKASEGRTTIIIAHRLSTVRNADRIIVLGKGKLLEQGTHQELLDKKGQYYQLVSLQMDATAEFDNESEGNKLLSRSLSHRLSVGSIPSRLGLDMNEDEDEENQKVKNVIWETMKLNGPEKVYIIIGTIMSFCVGAVFTVYAYFYGSVLGVFTMPDYEKAKRQSVVLAFTFAGIGIVAALVNFFQLLMFAISGEKLTKRLRLMSFTAMMKQEIGWHDRKENSVGSLCTVLSADAAHVQGATGVRLGNVLQGFASMGSAVGLSLYLNWELALIVYTSVPLLLVAAYYEGKLLDGQATMEQTSLDEANQLAVEALDNIRTVASLHREKKFHENYIERFKISLRAALRNTVVRAAMMAFSQSLAFFTTAGALVYGGYLMTTIGLKYSDLFKILESVTIGTFITAQAFAFTPDYQKAKVSAAKIIKLIRRVPEIDVTENSGQILKNFKGEITFNEVRFSYPTRPDVSVLRDVDLMVKPGMTVALVGSSGCGKSTCIQLIQRFYDSDFGDILMDSVDNTKLNLKWLRSQIGLVQQEPVLFDYSVAENIAYGKLGHDVPMDQIIKAAKDANIHKFITELPQGYETSVGSRGTQLSGGQKQRVAIARALIREPKLLLLDEATSALDSESEKIVEEALEKARHGRSCIVIAHRLSTIQNADCIVAMKNGKVVELGTHQELLKQRGFYYLLHKKQSGSMINN